MTDQPLQTDPQDTPPDATPDTPPDQAAVTLSRADAALVERLVSGELVGPGVASERVERARRLLGLLGRWRVADPDAGLSARAVGAVLGADPVSISEADGEALEGLLELRRAGLADGPMPAAARARAGRVAGVLSLMDRVDDEPVPEGLVERTMQAVERDRAEQRRRSAMRIGGPSEARGGGFNLRQLATTAALLLMVLSVLFPMLAKGKRDAVIARCGENLAGLGVDLQSFANDNKGFVTPAEADAPPAMFKELSGFARKGLNGAEVPASRVRLFVLLDQRRIDSAHLACPSTEPGHAAGYYNGQNPIAGGPLRLFLQPRPIFADTNPLYRVTPTGLVRNEAIPGLTRSANHDGAGQNMLVSDGSVKWTVRPAVLRIGDQPGDEEDNIWLLQNPVDGDGEPDVFLTP